MRAWLAACLVAGMMGNGVFAEAISPEWFIEAYVQQGRFRQAHALITDLERALGPEPESGTATRSAAEAHKESDGRARAALTRARIRLMLAERDWADGRAVAERCRANEPIVCTFAQGYAAARLAWPGAKADRITEAEICARQLEQAAIDPVSVTELYRVLVRSAIAAAQEETPELELLLAHAASLEKRLRETAQLDVPLQPASEIAGDLWMQVYRDDAARQSYRATLDEWPNRAASLLGTARASVRLHDDAAAKQAYRALLDAWRSADPARPELLEARRALGMTGAASSGEPADALIALLRTLRDAVDAEQARRDVQAIWETDRWFTFPKFEETAEHVAAMMRRAGLEEVEIDKPPADGVTQAGFWTMPLAWDAKAGVLEIVEPRVSEEQRVLADYQKVPSSLCMWSGPTPGGGDTIAEVVLAPENPAGMDLTGKLVLGRRGSKAALAKTGALGIISDATENPDLVDERGWVNSFGDNGWGFSKGNAPLVCFSIAPRGSRVLRDLIAKGPVKVRARVDTRYYAGVYPYVTGVIRGTDGASAEEVLSLGHLFEQGAHDNATGFASILGAAATLNKLIAAGTLPRPKRTIRVLGMGECYGTNYYLAHHTDRVKRTIAAMCIDSPAGLQTLAGTEHTWILNPHSASSFVDALVLRIAEAYYPMVGRPWHWVEHRSSTDNYLGDPSIGIPTVMPRGGYGVLAHHNSADRPDTVDPKSLRDLMVMNAAYTYAIAAAGPAERRWMAEVALTRAYDQIAAFAERTIDRIAIATTATQLSELMGQGRASVDYTHDRQARAVQSASDLPEGLADLAQFADRQRARVDRAVQDRASALSLGRIDPATSTPNANADAARIVVRRKRLGTITLDDLPVAEREGYPAASFWGVPVSALYWCDGKRTLAEVIRLTELEMGPQTFDFVGYFRFLEKHGYVEFVR